ncbi:META domain-containing protein [Chryseobacterium sp. SNU WT5]|uniref:copper resistance protein NlpE N-terminal domain-containing protein n=1 Tax=Chryseobacterium sp. SNU WT5 TaxID=2594269 RepID=UPI001180190A|nr:copper resistance protein NlpE N-terminal domain-containing protein [Chryseobacterium sp. SNU WT5]QDP85615.1 META domain-containing protein [Chryseobacterium sp. SNU WT5]
MKNKILKRLTSIPVATLFLLFVLYSCKVQNTEVSPIPDPAHTAQNSLDYDGIYRGTIPCADCEGIKATVYLMRNNTFKTVYEYLGRDVKPFETSGNFTWNEEGNTVSLKSANDVTSYFVGENTLTQLDQEGKKMTGALASKYVLSKDNYSILHRKWKLIELDGKSSTSQSMQKEAYIQFSDTDNRYSANGGCNTMSGTFATESNNRLNLGVGMSTLMACQDMTMEKELSKVLSTADRFQIDGNHLVLLKGERSLAKFVAPVN